MTSRQEILWREFYQRRSPAAKHKLATAYRELVRAVVWKMMAGRPVVSTVMDGDDLEQAGYIGLLEAIDRYDATKGVKFETYAVNRIRGAIQDELRTVDWVPRSVRKKMRQTEKEFEQRRQYSPTRAITDLTKNAIHGSHQFHKQQVEMMEPEDILEDFPSTAAQTVPADSGNPQQTLEERELREELIRSIERLGKRERLIITLYYFESLTLKEIAQILKISESRVSQIHEAILERFRETITQYV